MYCCYLSYIYVKLIKIVATVFSIPLFIVVECAINYMAEQNDFDYVNYETFHQTLFFGIYV